MLKTVKKNGSGIRVDPPMFFQNSHIFPFFSSGNVPEAHRGGGKLLPFVDTLTIQGMSIPEFRILRSPF